MKILIISYHFPPVMIVGGMRALSWAKYWSEAGHDITVIAGKYFSNKKNAKILIDVPKSVAVEYIDSLHSQIQSSTEIVGSQFSIKGKLINAIKLHAPIVDFDYKFIKEAKKKLRILKSQKEYFDFIISTSSPSSAHIIGLYAKKLFGSKWVADFRDLREQSIDSPKFGPLRERALTNFEKKVLKEADIITTVSEDLNNILKKKISFIESKAKSYCIYNGFFEEFFVQDKVTTHMKEWQIVYTGTYHERQFNIEPLFKALSQLHYEKQIPLPKLIFVGEERVSVQNLIAELASKYSFHNIQFIKSIPLKEAIDIQRNSSILLLLDGLTNRGVLKTKSYEYLAARKPIIAIVNPEGELAKKFLNGYDGYVVGDNPIKIKEFIEMIYKMRINNDDYNQKDNFFIPSTVIKEYSRKNQAMKLLEYMKQLD